MPKRVDHRERRALIADALMRVAAEQGLEAVSLRHVAAAAGVSAGMVQHYFRTRDEMMTFALAVVRERNEARVSRAIAALGATPAPRTLLRTMLAELLPLDEERRVDGRVALAFKVAEPEQVDALFELITGAGHPGTLKPFDAPWGQRYATVSDPDGTSIDLFCPLS